MRSFIYIFIGVALSFSVGSCKKLGCRDINSLTFDEAAKKDDGSCVYEGMLTIWFDQTNSADYLTLGVTELRFYLNNTYIGSSLPTDFSSSVPTCGASNVFSSKVTLGKVEKRDYTLTVRNESENFISTHGVTIIGNECLVFQLP